MEENKVSLDGLRGISSLEKCLPQGRLGVSEKDPEIGSKKTHIVFRVAVVQRVP